MKIKVQITVQADEGQAEVVHEVARLERASLQAEPWMVLITIGQEANSPIPAAGQPTA